MAAVPVVRSAGCGCSCSHRCLQNMGLPLRNAQAGLTAVWLGPRVNISRTSCWRARCRTSCCGTCRGRCRPLSGVSARTRSAGPIWCGRCGPRGFAARLRASRGLEPQEAADRGVPILRQAALDPGRDDVRADQDRARQMVSRDLPGHLEQGRHLGDGVAAADGLRQLRHSLGLAAQDPPRHDPAGSRAPAAAGRGRRDPGRRRQARQTGRGADGKTVVVGAVETKPGPNPGRGRKRPLGRLRLAAIPDASAASLEGFITADTEKPLTVTTDGWAGYRGLAAKGYAHEAINLPPAGATPACACPPSTSSSASPSAGCSAPTTAPSGPSTCSATSTSSSSASTAGSQKAISHGFARLIQHAVKTPPTTYRGIVHGARPEGCG
jgi:hypothetical protein